MSHHHSSVVFVFMLALVSLVVINFSLISAGHLFIAQVGSIIGVTASVPPNPVNTIADQLRKKEEELVIREKTLLERESSMLQGRGGTDTFAYSVTGLMFVIFIIHLYFDSRIRRNNKESQSAVSW